MKLNKNQKAFFALMRAGLWETEVQLLQFGELDYSGIQQLAEEQSVVGLLAAGMEHVVDTTIPKQVLLQFIGQTLQIEEQNKAMNSFIRSLVDKMRGAGIYTALVKGQGVAQCYEKPLWRTSGDVDLFLDADNYLKALPFLSTLASHVGSEDRNRMHVAMTVNSWEVELHGTMHTEISRRIDEGVDDVQKDIFENGGVRIWDNEGTDIPLPNPDNDVVIVFTHFIDHFYVGGVGLRQISDWCRLLWTYRESLNHKLLESRIREMGLMTEWKAFSAFAVEYLGMPSDAMPMYVSEVEDVQEFKNYKRKAAKICDLIMETGNFGHNKDESYKARYPKIVGKVITLFRRLGEFVRIASIFPGNASGFFGIYVYRRVILSV